MTAREETAAPEKHSVHTVTLVYRVNHKTPVVGWECFVCLHNALAPPPPETGAPL